MTSIAVFQPYPVFNDTDGTALDNGYIFIGQINQNPEINPIQVYWDDAFTQPVAQPLRTMNGYVHRNGTPAMVYAQQPFSMTVRNKKHDFVFYAKSVANFFSASSISYLARGTGAVQYDVQTRLRQFICLKDYGSVADGVTDDTQAWVNFKAASAGMKWIGAGSYLINGTVFTYPYDCIEDNIQLFPPNTSSTENRGTEYSFRSNLAALRVGESDTAPTNDERNYWRGLPSQNAWGNTSNIGISSVAFNRNGASYGTYTSTFGHDCVAYGIASIVGGAGSCSGDPDNPSSSNFEGYCSLAVGKNVLALGSKSVALCEESRAMGRATFATGYACIATSWSGDEGIGASAVGQKATAYGNGALAHGSYLTAQNGAMLIGTGINPGSPMTKSTKGLGFGVNVALPTFECVPGTGSSVNYGSLAYRGGLQTYGVEFTNAGLCATVQTLTNGGSGGYGEFHIKPLVSGSLVNGWTVDAGRVGAVVSLYPAVDAAMNLGAPAYRPNTIYAVNSVINTSDAREKQQIRDLNEKEKAVAKRLKYLVKAFKWNSSVKEKGEEARIHVGFIAQEVKEAFEAEGLIAENYSIFCYDEWPEQKEVKNENGVVVVEERQAGSRYGIRYDELLSFIIASI